MVYIRIFYYYIGVLANDRLVYDSQNRFFIEEKKSGDRTHAMYYQWVENKDNTGILGVIES